MPLPPLSLYIHVPWCVKKCPYCDFNSHQADRFTDQDGLPEAAYLSQLVADFDEEFGVVSNREIHSIFIGGGTPSLMSADFYQQLFSQLQQRVRFQETIEITMEANPGTFEQEKFAAYRKTGINRLSIGIQSFQPHLLKALGRIHNREEAIKAVKESRLAGFSNINIDLMHGLPNQTIEEALEDVQQAIELNPDHLSWYQLTIEPNTEFYRRPPILPEDTILWEIQDKGQQQLADAGYVQYEVSAYAQPKRQAQHNLNYWRFGDYIGIGAGAHGKITMTDGQAFRTRKTRHPSHYLANMPAALSTKESIPNEELAFEFMINRLRLFEAFPIEEFRRLCPEGNHPLFISACDTALSKGLLEATAWQQQTIQTTSQGKLFLNDLLELFLSPH